ncbi:DUF397 domain-containing protein [Streptomyces yaizuensis]|uniref:DUF397 domain-containing protein n=1 Tax=Streptomyces yaizuensis TaxID=2989713 RepID=A0ABQ5PA25_9ACTN|nr:DUF397 domain-containing protein [Streptomyces sp. YSPA8]GLF99449.1 DUF397 domain-containing protein [Streptomyces sp. YSPA8]
MRREADLTGAIWRKSSHSNSEHANCVEVSDDLPGLVPVRDSKLQTGPALVFGGPAWTAFVRDIAA